MSHREEQFQHTEVGHTNASGKIQHTSAIAKGNVRALAFGHNTLDLASQSFGDMLLAEVDERGMALGG